MIAQAHPASHHREHLIDGRFRLLYPLVHCSIFFRGKVHWELFLSSHRRGIRRQRHVLSHHPRRRQEYGIHLPRCRFFRGSSPVSEYPSLDATSSALYAPAKSFAHTAIIIMSSSPLPSRSSHRFMARLQLLEKNRSPVGLHSHER